MTKTFVRFVLPFAAGTLLLAGCSDTKSGTASPATSESAASSETASSGAQGGATTTSLQPCSLLTVSDLGSYGSFDGPEEKNLGGARACKFTRKITSAADKSMGVGVAIRDETGIDAATDLGGGLLPKEVNGRKSVEIPDGKAKGCILALGVGKASRVDVTVTGVETAEACQQVEKIATNAVEPKLPKG